MFNWKDPPYNLLELVFFLSLSQISYEILCMFYINNEYVIQLCNKSIIY